MSTLLVRRQHNHFGPTHPLARVARRRCDREHALAGAALVGGVACGTCWERTIRDDERVVVEFELPREVRADRALVDEIAVERACDGERVPLTRAERLAAAARLSDRGWTRSAVARLLRIPPEFVPCTNRRPPTTNEDGPAGDGTPDRASTQPMLATGVRS